MIINQYNLKNIFFSQYYDLFIIKTTSIIESGWNNACRDWVWALFLRDKWIQAQQA